MNLRKPLILAASAATLLAATALPASAAAGDPIDTATTFTIAGGALEFTTPTTADLGTAFTTGTLTITGPLGAVSVTDERGGVQEWIVSAASTSFIGSQTSESTAVSYAGGVVTETGTITVANGVATALTVTDGVPDSASVVAPSFLSGNNTASWNPLLSVTMPANALADAYAGTVTTSIL